MAQVTYPGVYVEEVPSGVRPITGVSTSVPGFIGVAERGPVREAVKIFNFTEYQNRYGGFLSYSYLSHAVFQFFNNGGTQCYVVRVSGDNATTADIVINDRAASAHATLTIAASSPGVWGNSLAIVIVNGTNDPANEFNLSLYDQDGLTLLETFENLSMVSGAPNFVQTVTSTSQYIRVTIHENPNADETAGTSRGAAAPQPLQETDQEVQDILKTQFRININDDGYQEVELKDAVGDEIETGQVADLRSDVNIAAAIAFVVRKLTPRHATTAPTAFTNFTCQIDNGVLLLTSGAPGALSSVHVTRASNNDHDASGLLRLGLLQRGTETLGVAVTRPGNNPADKPYLVGDNTVTPVTPEVASVQAGSGGGPITGDQPYLEVFYPNACPLDDKEDVSLIAVPGIGSSAVVGAGMNYCEKRSLSDCFFIGDMSQDDDTIEEAKSFRDLITPKNSYGAIYLPWVRMLDPTGRSAEPILVPPSGFVAGLYARTDGRIGVWKAPAGTGTALGGAVGLAVQFTDVQQGNLNPINVNVIRQFAASGIVLWGARTITADPEWTYIPVRRMAIFLRVSIYRGIQWAVFEPNDEDLWASLRLNIDSFMMNLFRQGAFQGATPSQAFFVKCDSETTTQGDIDLGIVNVLVGFAPLKPAEFVVVKISQKVGEVA